ncbi:disco-interacting protein 2 homolog C-like isoform X2 [Oreochromis niloticus]|uniref:disco-interacting protein 2 homolog C-like isoform X2 n=1 Tax=Oreochromis niloticus TaxID=8128 RepID=UPI000DF249C2|nr:disco-interacting protein 2 homolog C-like isoform X2 [Oreochromis niloticus]XP_025759552.1 disco-interacting protein 2 homolog C-like isoform X2 [Oreochromis niloticus]XP_025759553.1 disco-interacting protein 2 homolog C-like isoform X2 [Oreochromis niloticus]XP_025759556.1 disco-interacting protein 2 homolog C-like isoform X2 [Oreochromis niloticus]
MNCSLCPLSVAGGFLMAHTVPLSHLLQGAVSSSLTCLQTAEGVAALLMERGGLEEGDNVALVYPPGIDLIAALYGCLYAGCVPITVRPPHPQNISTTLPTVKMIVEVSHSACVMTTAVICKLLRSKEAMATVDISPGHRYSVSFISAQGNHARIRLSVCRNNITSEGLLLLARAVKSSSTLTHIYIWGNHLEEPVCQMEDH